MSGNAPLSTDYYIRPLAYNSSISLNHGLINTFLSELAKSDYDRPAAAMKGISILYQASRMIL